MFKSLGVLVIHGMGDHRPNFADRLIRHLNKGLGKLKSRVVFQACHWSPILQAQQDITWQRMVDGGLRMDLRRLRRWIISALGDPATYLSGFFKDDRPVYAEIHERVRSSLQALEPNLDPAGRKPLMVLAHSLGSVIFSNYIWDQTHEAVIGKTPFEKTETLTSFITYGSNIPLFLPPAPPTKCIRFPSDKLPPELAAVAAWDNLYDPDDVLGYPLADVWDETQGTVIHDRTINVGPWPKSGTPLAHTSYDADADFVDVVVDRMKKILAVS